MLKNAQIVLWYVNRTFTPAIYCPDIITALYIHTFFLAPAGEEVFPACRFCANQFFQIAQSVLLPPCSQGSTPCGEMASTTKNGIGIYEKRGRKKNGTQKTR